MQTAVLLVGRSRNNWGQHHQVIHLTIQGRQQAGHIDRPDDRLITYFLISRLAVVALASSLYPSFQDDLLFQQAALSAYTSVL